MFVIVFCSLLTFLCSSEFCCFSFLSSLVGAGRGGGALSSVSSSDVVSLRASRMSCFIIWFLVFCGDNFFAPLAAGVGRGASWNGWRSSSDE